MSSQPYTREIPPEQWTDFFNSLSDQYRGWEASIEVMSGELGDQPEAHGLPLQGITYETAGSEANNIIIDLGDTPEVLMSHLVDRPQQVRIADTQPGGEADLQITAGDGTATLLRLRHSPELPA